VGDTRKQSVPLSTISCKCSAEIKGQYMWNRLKEADFMYYFIYCQILKYTGMAAKKPEVRTATA